MVDNVMQGVDKPPKESSLQCAKFGSNIEAIVSGCIGGFKTKKSSVDGKIGGVGWMGGKIIA